MAQLAQGVVFPPNQGELSIMALQNLLVYGMLTGDNTYPHSGNFTADEFGQITVDDSDGVNDGTFDDFTDGGTNDVPDQNVTASTVPGIDVGDAVDSRYTYAVTGSDGSSGNVWFLAVNTPYDYGTLMVSDFQMDPSVTYTFGAFNRQGQHSYNDLVPCFAEGTLIETSTGLRRIEELRAGDTVAVLDGGVCPIRWIGARHLDAIDLALTPKLRPICIRAGALGQLVPDRDLVVSPQHRILVRSRIAQRMFGAPEVLVPAIKLLALPNVDVLADVQHVTYFHMLFDDHQIVRSNNALTESLFTGRTALAGLSKAARQEILQLFPQICATGYRPHPARPIAPRPQAARRLVERHAANGVALQ